MQEITLQVSVIRRQAGETETIEQRHAAKMTKKAGGWYVSYTETMEGIGEVPTVVKIGETDVTVLRQGKLQTKQRFAKGETSDAPYISPYGRFLLETYTRRLRIRHEDNRPVQVEMAYQLWMNGEYLGEYDCTYWISAQA